MSQRYLNEYLGTIRSKSSDSFQVYKSDGSNIISTGDVNALLAELLIDYSDGNRNTARELVVLNYNSYDETYTPITGDYTYDTAFFFAVVMEKGSTLYSDYTAGSTNLYITSDKNALLVDLKNNYGDGRFRIFQKMVISNTHSFVLEP